MGSLTTTTTTTTTMTTTMTTSTNGVLMDDHSVRISELPGHSHKVYALGWNSTGKYLASGSTDKGIRIWDVKSERESSANLKGHTDSVHQLCWDPSNPHRLASTSEDKTVRIWDSKSASVTACVSLSEPKYNISYSHDGHYVAVSSKSTIELIDTRKGRVRAKSTNPFEANEIKFRSSSGDLYVAGGHASGNGTIEILRIESSTDTKKLSLQPQDTLTAHSGHCYCLDLDPLDRYVAVGSNDGLVSIWDLEDMYCIRTMAQSSEFVRTVSFSFDGNWIASDAGAEKFYISSTENGKIMHSTDLRAQLQFLTWNPKSLLLAYVGDRSDAERNRGREGVIKLLRVRDTTD